MNAVIQTAFAAQTIPQTFATRDELITEHLHLVNSIATQVRRSLAVHVELDDLVHSGMMGLFDAATKYTSDKEVAFSTYAKHRIRGAILDGLRQLDWASRDLRKRYKQVDAKRKELAETLKREATDVEVAQALGLDSKRWQSLMVDFRNMGAAANQSRAERDDEQPLQDAPCSPANGPDQVFARAEMRNKLGFALQNLPQRYQDVVTMYYEQDLTMKEIGKLLGVNESRVCQIHKSALLRMQSALQNNGVQSASAFVN
ncbi:MAG: sigma-70 family RNA polymerase sigma factor [Bryobacteraceae bacterium]